MCGILCWSWQCVEVCLLFFLNSKKIQHFYIINGLNFFFIKVFRIDTKLHFSSNTRLNLFDTPTRYFRLNFFNFVFYDPAFLFLFVSFCCCLIVIQTDSTRLLVVNESKFEFKTIVSKTSHSSKLKLLFLLFLDQNIFLNLPFTNRFPFLVFSNGGGAFIIPYFIMLLVCGMPLFLMELALGQYFHLGPVTTWSLACPLGKGN